MVLSFIGLLIHLALFQENLEDLLGVKGPLQFNKTDFHLYLSGRPEKNMTLHVYLPKGEDLDNYNQKLSLTLLNTKKDVVGVIKDKIKALAARQKTDFNCKFSSRDLVEGKETIIDYTQSESDGKKLSEAEINVSRVKWLSDHDNGSYILVYTYSWRTYDAEAVDMIKNINSYKVEFLQEISQKEVPQVKIGN